MVITTRNTIENSLEPGINPYFSVGEGYYNVFHDCNKSRNWIIYIIWYNSLRSSQIQLHHKWYEFLYVVRVLIVVGQVFQLWKTLLLLEKTSNGYKPCFPSEVWHISKEKERVDMYHKRWFSRVTRQLGKLLLAKIQLQVLNELHKFSRMQTEPLLIKENKSFNRFFKFSQNCFDFNFIRLCAQEFHQMIVDEGGAQVNYYT